VLKVDESIPPVYVPPAPAWEHGTPDQILPIGNDVTIDAGSPFAVKRFIVNSGIDTPQRIRAIALKQGDRRVVRHAAYFESASGRWIGAWTPWQSTTRLPQGAAYRLPARAQIVVEIGYSGTTETVTDKSELGLYFDTGSPHPNALDDARRGRRAERTADSMTLRSTTENMPAGAVAHRVRTETKVAAPMSVVAIWPTPSEGARSIEITATTPDGVVSPLLWVKEFRADWRSPYVLSSPLALAAGTRLKMTTYFDNPSEKAATARAEAWLAVVPGSTTTKSKPSPPSPKQ
jgi:hypothetical protein